MRCSECVQSAILLAEVFADLEAERVSHANIVIQLEAQVDQGQDMLADLTDQIDGQQDTIDELRVLVRELQRGRHPSTHQPVHDTTTATAYAPPTGGAVHDNVTQLYRRDRQ